MSAKIDCPICMDCIESTTKNCVTTDCGHCFHTNCLMQNVAHNGFGCPYCRTIMAEEPEEEEEESVVYDDDNDEENVLRGFRFFFNNLNGEEHDADDIREEEQLCDDEDAEEVEPNNSFVIVPSTAFVAEKLREQGVTFEHLVKLMCETEHDEFEFNEESQDTADKLYGKVRRIIAKLQMKGRPMDCFGFRIPMEESGEDLTADMVMLSSRPRVPNIDFYNHFQINLS
jgi:hypothetical protein